MEEAIPTYSVSFRLQRTTTEVAFVSVSVTNDLIVEQPDGTGRIDVEKLMQRAVELGHAASVAWQPEELRVEPHPIQTPPPGLGGDGQVGEPSTSAEGGA